MADFQKHFGIDLEREYRRGRSWAWFEVRVLALLSIGDSLLGRSADQDTPPPPDPQGPPADREDLAA